MGCEEYKRVMDQACHNCKKTMEKPFEVGLPVSLCERCAVGYYRHSLNQTYGDPFIERKRDPRTEFGAKA